MNRKHFIQFRFLTAVLLAVILLSAVMPQAVYSQKLDEKKLEKFIKQGMKDWKIPGLAVAVVKDDKIAYAKGFGVKEMDKPDKVDKTTIFAVASNHYAWALLCKC